MVELPVGVGYIVNLNDGVLVLTVDNTHFMARLLGLMLKT
jgi:hypothetical protein